MSALDGLTGITEAVNTAWGRRNVTDRRVVRLPEGDAAKGKNTGLSTAGRIFDVP